jgi:hypothetical protein
VTEHRQGQRGPRRAAGRALADAALKGAAEIVTRARAKEPDKPEIPEGKKIVRGMLVPDFSKRQTPAGTHLKRQTRTEDDVRHSRRRRARNVARAQRRSLRPKRKHGRQVRVR